MDVLVHHDLHARNEQENGWYRNVTVIPLVQDHEGLLRGFSTFPLMFGNEDLKKRLLLPLEGKYAFDIQVPAVLVQRCHYCDAQLP